MAKVEFCIYGKEGCKYCEQRLEHVSKFAQLNSKLADFKINYRDSETGEGLAELMMLDNVDITLIPIVTMSINGKLVGMWQGYEKENVPTTRKFLNLLEEKGATNG